MFAGCSEECCSHKGFRLRGTKKTYTLREGMASDTRTMRLKCRLDNRNNKRSVYGYLTCFLTSTHSWVSILFAFFIYKQLRRAKRTQSGPWISSQPSSYLHPHPAEALWSCTTLSHGGLRSRYIRSARWIPPSPRRPCWRGARPPSRSRSELRLLPRRRAAGLPGAGVAGGASAVVAWRGAMRLQLTFRPDKPAKQEA